MTSKPIWENPKLKTAMFLLMILKFTRKRGYTKTSVALALLVGYCYTSAIIEHAKHTLGIDNSHTGDDTEEVIVS